MRPVLLLDVVGLSKRLIGDDTPALRALAARGACAPMSTVLPAVTMSAQATMLTGLAPSEHGVVGNGWCDPRTREIAFWKQSNALVDGKKLYERARAGDRRAARTRRRARPIGRARTGRKARKRRRSSARAAALA